MKSIIGGLAISYLDKAESGMQYSIESLLYNKLHKQSSKTKWLRGIWLFWLSLSLYLLMVPFTAEMATLPMIGGLLKSLET